MTLLVTNLSDDEPDPQIKVSKGQFPGSWVKAEGQMKLFYDNDKILENTLHHKRFFRGPCKTGAAVKLSILTNGTIMMLASTVSNSMETLQSIRFSPFLSRKVERVASEDYEVWTACEPDRGTVFQASRINAQGDKQLVVLKRFLTIKNKQFLAEVRSAKIYKASSPYIIRYTGIVEEENSDSIFLEMPWFEKGNLCNFLAEQPPLSAKEKQKIAKQLLLGLKFIHANNIIHRDLKPENILIDQNNSPIISDFATATKTDISSSGGTVVGTWGYTAPEVFDNQAIPGLKQDMFGIGAVLYDLYYGPMVVARARDYPKVDDACDENVENLIRNLLSENPDQRKSASEALQHPFFDSDAIGIQGLCILCFQEGGTRAEGMRADGKTKCICCPKSHHYCVVPKSGSEKSCFEAHVETHIQKLNTDLDVEHEILCCGEGDEGEKCDYYFPDSFLAQILRSEQWDALQRARKAQANRMYAEKLKIERERISRDLKEEMLKEFLAKEQHQQARKQLVEHTRLKIINTILTLACPRCTQVTLYCIIDH